MGSCLAVPEKEGGQSDHNGITHQEYDKGLEGALITTLSLAPPPIDTDLFKLAHIQGKGFGLVAKVDIMRGTMIIEEEAILTEAMSMRVEDRITTLPHRFAALTDGEKLQFATLARTEHQYNQVFATIDEEICPREPSEDRINELYFGAILHSIIMTNSFSSGVHPTVSRINHSCTPNCEAYNLSGKRCSVEAIRDVKAGEELIICYTDYSYNYERKFDHLIDEYGFICQCVLCASETRGKFEGRRDRLRRLAHDIDFLQCRMNVQAGSSAVFVMDPDCTVRSRLEGPLALKLSSTKSAYAALNELELLLREESTRTSFIKFIYRTGYELALILRDQDKSNLKRQDYLERWRDIAAG